MKQITIVTENPSGLLSRVATIIADRGINISSLSAESAGHLGVVILTVDERYDEALVALRDAGLPAISEDAIIVSIPDEPGALARLSSRFFDAGIPLKSLRLLKRSKGSGLVAISAERSEEVLRLVQDIRVS